MFYRRRQGNDPGGGAMAKVYDALKQVEAERSRQLQAEARAVRALERRDEPKFWRRWSERLARNGGENGNGVGRPAANAASSTHVREVVTAAPDPSVRQHMDTILGRLDAFEHLARERLPEMERNLLTVLESRIDTVEREVASSVSTIGRQMREEVAALHRRLGILLGAVAALAVALLLRG